MSWLASMPAAQVNEQQTNYHQSCAKNSEGIGWRLKVATSAIFDLFGGRKVGKAFHEAYEAQYGKKVCMHHLASQSFSFHRNPNRITCLG